MEYAETITAEKVRRVMGGYGGNQPHPPPNLPLEGGGTERQADLSLELPPLQGEGRGGGMGDYGDDANKGACHAPLQIPHHATTLDHEFLSTLTFPDNRKPATSVICADNCLLSQEQPRKHGIIFKKIPRDISRF